MIIAEVFKNTIASTFYDKEIDVYEVTNITETDGFNHDTIGSSTGSFMGNINFDITGRLIQEKYGYVKDLAGVITTSVDNNFEEGSVFKYNGVFYKVFKKVTFDSHNLYVIQNGKWE